MDFFTKYTGCYDILLLFTRVIPFCAAHYFTILKDFPILGQVIWLGILIMRKLPVDLPFDYHSCFKPGGSN